MFSVHIDTARTWRGGQNQVLSTVLEDSIDSLISDVYKGMDAVVRSPQSQDLGFGQVIRTPVDAGVVEQVSAVDGVREARGVVEASTAQLRRLFAGMFVRVGAYGDPAAVPIDVWRAMLADARGWTAYTHRWKAGASLQGLAMASCETDADTREAEALGYRYRGPAEATHYR